MGGLVTSLCEVVPPIGEIVDHDGLRLTVVSADERRVRELMVEKVPS